MEQWEKDERRFRNRIIASVIFGLLLIGGFITGYSGCATVPAGSVGVLTLFGRVTGEQLPEGIHWVNPFKVNNTMTLRTQSKEETSQTPSSEGLNVDMDVTILYHLDGSKASNVYQTLGDEYEKQIVIPEFRSAIRDTTADHKAASLYSAERSEVQQTVFHTVRDALAPRGIVVESVLLRGVRLPPDLAAAIEEKQRMDQESQAMAFRLTKEKQEAERKRIEAQGIHDFQAIVSQGISDQLLQWKGIEATERLADSQNTKVVIIGNHKNGLPLVLGGADSK